ncbi:MAG: MotA/TolQ/ExbB proton channel family protein, partial [Myxococcaceae bacterium]
MNLGFVTNLSILANAGGGNETFLQELGRRWESGQAGMYPIALCLVVALAIIVERSIVLFGKASINKEGFLRGLKKHIYAGDLDKAINYVAG